MTLLAVIAVLVTGFSAGVINTIVGSGSLVTFPTLLALGIDPVTANVSNGVGLFFGSISGTHGYRRELRGQSSRLRDLLPYSVAGGLAGAVLLLAFPGRAFERIVPWLVLIAVALVIVQPQLSRRLAKHRGGAGSRWALRAGVLITGVYGGYFGAAQGVILITLLAVLVDDNMQRLNACKNALAAAINGVSMLYFLVIGHVNTEIAMLLAVSSIGGAQLGATVGRRIPSAALRGVIVVGGLAAVIRLLWFS